VKHDADFYVGFTPEQKRRAIHLERENYERFLASFIEADYWTLAQAKALAGNMIDRWLISRIVLGV